MFNICPEKFCVSSCLILSISQGLCLFKLFLVIDADHMLLIMHATMLLYLMES